MDKEEKLRLFKIEFDGQDPIVTTGELLLEQARKESNEEFPFSGTTIDEAFSYFNEFESIQECELPKSLTNNTYKQIRQLEQENKNMKKEIAQIGCGMNGRFVTTLYGKPIDYYLTLKQENEKLTQKLEKAKKALKTINSFDCCTNCKDKDEKCWQCDDEHYRHSFEPTIRVVKTTLKELEE